MREREISRVPELLNMHEREASRVPELLNMHEREISRVPEVSNMHGGEISRVPELLNRHDREVSRVPEVLSKRGGAIVDRGGGCRKAVCQLAWCPRKRRGGSGRKPRRGNATAPMRLT